MSQRSLDVEALPLATDDAIFDLLRLYKKDTNLLKVNLVIGAYRDDNGKPYIFPVVRKSEQLILSDPSTDHEYLDISGLKEFRSAVSKLVLGSDYCAKNQSNVLCLQTISGTGAIFVFARMISKFFAEKTIYIPDPSWVNHFAIFDSLGLNVEKYPYYDYQNLCLNFSNFCSFLQTAKENSIILLQVSCHNPTGIDPTLEQWGEIALILKKKNIYPLFDMAYQGFASGNPESDRALFRIFLDNGFELAIAQTFSKNLGLYGERIGSLTFVVKNNHSKKILKGQMRKIIRQAYSNPPKFPALVASKILNVPELYKEWLENLNSVASRLRSIRACLYDALIKRGTPGNWRHIIEQNGMFSLMQLNTQQIDRLRNEFHIYIVKSGRISFSGLRSDQVEYLADSIHSVVTQT